LEEKENKYGKDAVRHIFRIMMLQVIDTLWMDHLDQMEHLRNSVNLRAYGQRDPLVEYKKEGLRMFRSLEARLYDDLLSFIENIDSFLAQEAAKANAQFVPVIPTSQAVAGEITTGTVTNADKHKYGRNDPCPCGSGKKVKKCDCVEYAYLRA
jgi:preprotein translocase subunit SecA